MPYSWLEYLDALHLFVRGVGQLKEFHVCQGHLRKNCVLRAERSFWERYMGLKNLLQISSLKWAHDVYILRKIKPHLAQGVGIVTDILINGLLYSLMGLEPY
jgi:hypothetical protein